MRPLEARPFLSSPSLPYKVSPWRRLSGVTAPFKRKVLTREAIVVGCGVAGLTTAVRLLEGGFKVRIVSRERTPNTTSDIAAAVWYPFRCGPPDRALLWSRRSFRVFRELAHDEATGVTLVPGVDLLRQHDGSDPWWKEAVDTLRAAEPAELAPGYVAGHVFTAPVIAMPVYMKWLESRVAAAGGAVETRSVSNLEALLLEASLVVNCTGLGARELVKDDEVHPIRGQIVRVAAGHTHRFVQAAGADTPLAYIIPRPDCTVLGGTEDVDDWGLEVDRAAADAILARCRALEPRLHDAPVLSHAVGLRPGRREVRLETVRNPGGIVIHNYGHGGGGVTLSWGCADEVARRAATEIPRT
jgi:D-amino-acid oxidase